MESKSKFKERNLPSFQQLCKYENRLRKRAKQITKLCTIVETSLQRTNGNNIPFTSHERKEKQKYENDQLFILTKLIQKTNYSNVYLPRRKQK